MWYIQIPNTDHPIRPQVHHRPTVHLTQDQASLTDLRTQGCLVHSIDVRKASQRNAKKCTKTLRFPTLRDVGFPCAFEGCSSMLPTEDLAKAHFRREYAGVKYPCTAEGCSRIFKSMAQMKIDIKVIRKRPQVAIHSLFASGPSRKRAHFKSINIRIFLVSHTNPPARGVRQELRQVLYCREALQGSSS